MAAEVLGPPDISGYRHIRRLGRGGFADVYLYEQYRPKREVAIKVLFADAEADVSERFTAEADVMAQLSSHATIIPIYQAGTSEDGRPYLVMEYCPGPNLAIRSRAERIGVPEALAIGIQVAGAVETAHRAGILHRDIKPHNILTNAYNRPKLTDFGIAQATSAQQPEAGLSVPWAAPELFGDQQDVDPRSDVYSLAATVYTLLAGRPPFEIPGADNDNTSMMRRILRSEVPSTGRDDVPEELQRVFVRALGKNPAQRYDSALSLARAWQEVEIALRLPTTAVEVLDATVPVIEGESEDAMTRVRPIAVIRPDASSGVATAPRPDERPAPTPAWERPPGQDAPPMDTVRADPPPVDGPVQAADEAQDVERRSPLRLIGAVVAVVLVAGALGSAYWFGAIGDRGQGPTDGTESPGNVVPVTARPSSPQDLRGEVTDDGTVEFTWANPAGQDDDRYQWRFTEAGADSQYAYVDEPRLVADLPDGVNGCVAVSVVRGSQASDPVSACPERD